MTIQYVPTWHWAVQLMTENGPRWLRRDIKHANGVLLFGDRHGNFSMLILTPIRMGYVSVN